MKAKANKAILEQERKKKERLANSSRLTIIRIDLTHKEEEKTLHLKMQYAKNITLILT